MDHIELLRRFNAWRTGEDDRTMDEVGLVPSAITAALNAVIDEVEALRAKLKEKK